MLPLNVVSAAAGNVGYVLVAGTWANNVGYYRSTEPPAGTLRPDEISGFEIDAIGTGFNDFEFFLTQANVPNTDATFRSLTISGLFVEGQRTYEFLRSAGAYSGSIGGRTRWDYQGEDVPGGSIAMISGETYIITFEVG